MRVMIRFSLSVATGNELLRSGKLQKVFDRLLTELKPEAGYFYPNENGERSGFFVIDLTDSSQIAETVEKLFFGLEAKVNLVPVMNGNDLTKALSGVKSTIERYG